MKKAIISLGIDGLYGDKFNGRKRKFETYFGKSVLNLKKNIEELGFDGDVLIWDKELPRGCPSFIESPFAFKPVCFKEVREQGYDLVLWMDSIFTFPSLLHLNMIFKIIEKRGYFFIRNKNFVGKYCSDESLKMLEINREDAMTIQSLQASNIGLDFRDKRSNLFLDEWLKFAMDGITFVGKKGISYHQVNVNNIFSDDKRVKGHRHDQTAASVIAFKLKMIIESEYRGEDFFIYDYDLKYRKK